MLSLMFSLLLGGGAFAADVPAGCVSSRNFTAEAYKIWISEGTKVSASVEQARGPVVATGQRIDLQLVSGESSANGFVKFEVATPGSYVIVSDAYPRMDVTELASGASFNPVDFGKIRDCGTVSKALRFEFAKTGSYSLGFVSSQGPGLNFMIIKMP
ncbi:hypothetical protein [Bdellovibrio bacteriovorus]|uniref:Uncharacterized protein n=1 Tax=Bdellovibrio bacteriovorus str. Tiberius TaxID=1069642 RepID=K7YUZ0_BDEBC|nr:hypothetical protein [Bdellovibrio bacteriovorus]AFY01458.1 hypothetical protein Bdt_1768 [Bdellovibrio bacteriovorus str. Tiberius]